MKRKSQPAIQSHDARIREGMAALLVHPSLKAASAATGIPRVTLQRWRSSPEGKAILADLSARDGDSRVKRIWALVDKMLTQLDEAIDARKIPPTALAVNIGILSDKAKQMAAPAQSDPGGGVWEVSVKFGGVRVEDRPAAQTVEAQVVEVRASGG